MAEWDSVGTFEELPNMVLDSTLPMHEIHLLIKDTGTTDSSY